MGKNVGAIRTRVGIKSLKVTILLSLVLSVVLVNTAMASVLDDYRWNNRILIVIVDELEDHKVSEVSQILADAECALQDRDMLVTWIYSEGEGRVGDITLSSPDVLELRKQFRLPRSSRLIAALVGKDGGVKARYTEWPALAEVFALIDGMPMRRAEMYRDSDDCAWQEKKSR